MGRFKSFKSVVSALAIAVSTGVMGAVVAMPATALGDQPVHVQLSSFMSPVAKDGKRAGYFPITIFLEVSDLSTAHAVCRESPRMRDTILDTLFKHMPTVHPNVAEIQVDSRTSETHVRTALNAILEGEPVRRVYMIEGVVKMGTGVSARLPFASSTGCRTDWSRDGDQEKPNKAH